MMASVDGASSAETRQADKGRESGTPHKRSIQPRGRVAGNYGNQPTGNGTMTLNPNVPLKHRSPVLKSILEISSLFWSGSVTEEELSASRGWLRRFILLKLVTVLLFPRGAVVPMMVGCIFSLRALLLLRGPHISTKPSTVFLAQLALADVLVLLHWALRVGATLAGSLRELKWDSKMGLIEQGELLWWRDVVSLLCQQLLDAQHLASLLLLGLLGLEATLVSRWPKQTRRLRTSHWAQLSCSLVWMLALLELGLSLHSNISQYSRPQTYSSTPQHCEDSYVGATSASSMAAFSPCLRQMLWLGNLWMHYFIFQSKPRKRKSSYH